LGQPTRDRSHRGAASVATVYGRTRTRDPEVAPPRKPRRKRPAWAIVLSVIGTVALLASIGGYVTVRAGLKSINDALPQQNLLGGGDAGGFQLLAATLKQQWGLSFNAGAIVNFNGFQDIVTQLGGVSMYIDETVYSIHRGHNIATGAFAAPYHINPDTGVPMCSDPYVTFDSDPLKCAIPGVRPVVYAQGQRHLDAPSALDFVRARDGLDGTDYARQRHQLQFIKAVMSECYSKGLSDPLKLTDFIRSVAKAFTFDGNGTQIGDWIFTLKGIKPTALVSIKMNGGAFVTYKGPAPDSRQDLNQTSLSLLKAITTDTNPNEDKVGEFISQYPSWIAR
jgi:polyisoprenyl-teichoic acid--peptidoglycan teichoic acid transferase